ncbi:hypothetical protein [Pandoravirus japonicus]|uniref:Uncharacterized protein n=1 Tax=Pandoravirus japonicus TaxID=2823154 RepID=A0A811BLK7_9VIRU|nr:hypothetical protein [Pandoravirus japonicus]
MTTADTEKSDTASAARSASSDAEAALRFGTVSLACISIVFALQSALVAAAIGTLAVRSPENAAGCERLVNWLFTSVCLASVAAATALAAQAWRDRARDAAPDLLYSAPEDDHGDAIGILGHRMRVTGDHTVIAPCAAPGVCLLMADTINSHES